MKSTASSMSFAEGQAIKAEAARIAKLGGTWLPTEESLKEVVVAVKEASKQESRALQRAGIEAARKRGAHLGRPKLSIPSSFEEYAKAVQKGTTSKSAAARALSVSRETFSRWYASWETR